MKTLYHVEFKWLVPKSPWTIHSTYKGFETRNEAKEALTRFPNNPDVKFRITKTMQSYFTLAELRFSNYDTQSKTKPKRAKKNVKKKDTKKKGKK